MPKRILSIILVLIFTFSILSFSASAAVVEQGDITIGTVTGIIGDSVVVPINIENNPGISAITVSLTYDSSVLEFEERIVGNVLSKEAEAVAHPSRNIIRFVTSEMGNKKANGTLISLKFKIKPGAEDKLYKIDMKFSSGDFCNWKLDRIMPTVTSGGVQVYYTEETCPHKEYGEWSVAAVPSCEESGLDSRICKKCNHTDLKEKAPIGHEYSDEWTVDREATEKKDGLMSRHCIRCSHFVDQITFKFEQVNEGKIENTYGDQTKGNDYIVNIFKEQNPDQELTPNIPPAETDEDLSDSSDTSSQTSQIENTSSENSSDNNNTSNTESDENQAVQNDTADKNNDSKTNEEKVQLLKTYYDKISEAFPNAELIINTFKISITVLILLVL